MAIMEILPNHASYQINGSESIVIGWRLEAVDWRLEAGDWWMQDEPITKPLLLSLRSKLQLEYDKRQAGDFKRE
jgi:hypothetical protein